MTPARRQARATRKRLPPDQRVRHARCQECRAGAVRHRQKAQRSSCSWRTRRPDRAAQRDDGCGCGQSRIEGTVRWGAPLHACISYSVVYKGLWSLASMQLSACATAWHDGQAPDGMSCLSLPPCGVCRSSVPLVFQYKLQGWVFCCGRFGPLPPTVQSLG